jgi:hypothetical protein
LSCADHVVDGVPRKVLRVHSQAHLGSLVAHDVDPDEGLVEHAAVGHIAHEMFPSRDARVPVPAAGRRDRLCPPIQAADVDALCTKVVDDF